MSEPRNVRALLIDAEQRRITEITIPITGCEAADRKHVATLLHCSDVDNEWAFIMHGWLEEISDVTLLGDALEAEDRCSLDADPRHWFTLDPDPRQPAAPATTALYGPVAGYGVVVGYDLDFELVDAEISLDALRARVTFLRLRRILTPIEGSEGRFSFEVVSEN